MIRKCFAAVMVAAALWAFIGWATRTPQQGLPVPAKGSATNVGYIEVSGRPHLDFSKMQNPK